MKTVFLSINSGFGGAEIYFQQLANDFALVDGTTRFIELDSKQISIFSILFIISQCLGAKVVLNSSVLGTSFFPFLLARIFCRRLYLFPHVVAPIDLLKPRLRTLRRLCRALMLYGSSRVVAISEGNRTELENQGVNPGKIFDIFNYVSQENNLAPSTDGFDFQHVAVIGRIQFCHKQQDVILKTAAKVLKEKRIKISFFGDGPDMKKLMELSDSLELGDQVVFWGWRSREQIYAEDFGIVLNFSAWEGLPLTLLEAVYHDRLVFSSCVNGNRELALEGCSLRDRDDLEEAFENIADGVVPAVSKLNEHKQRIYSQYSKDNAMRCLAQLTSGRVN